MESLLRGVDEGERASGTGLGGDVVAFVAEVLEGPVPESIAISRLLGTLLDVDASGCPSGKDEDVGSEGESGEEKEGGERDKVFSGSGGGVDPEGWLPVAATDVDVGPLDS